MAKKLPDYAKVVAKKKDLPEYATRVGPYANYVPGQDPKGLMRESAEAVQDAATVVPQATTLELGDEILDTLSPGLGQEYLQQVNAARDRSPIATSVAEILAPNPAGKLRFGGKLIEKVAPEIATSVISQFGRNHEVDPSQVALDTVIGKGIQTAAKSALVGDRIKRRASAVGANRAAAIKRYRGKAGKRGFEDELIQEQIQDLEKAGLFHAGAVGFNPRDMRFETKPTATQAVSSVILPPSDKELVKRLITMQDAVGSRLDELVERNQYAFEAPLDDDFFKDMKAQMEDAVYSNKDTVDKVFPDIMDRINTENVTLTDLYALKKELYKVVGDPSFQKLMEDNPDKATAYRNAASYLNDTITELVGDPSFKTLNKMYGTASDMMANLKGKISRDFTGMGPSSAVAIGSPMYRAARMLEESREKMMGMSAQLTGNLERIPYAPEYLRGVGAAAVPRTVGRNEQGRSPQSVDENMNIPLQLSTMTLPRTSEAILENKNLVLAKVAQEKPAAYGQVKFLLEQRPQDLKRALPMLISVAPGLFEHDEYNRVDGKIMDPQMAEKARQDIMLDPKLTNTQRIELMDKLNRFSTLEDY